MTGDRPNFREVVEKLKADKGFDSLCRLIKKPTAKVSDALGLALFTNVAFNRNLSDDEFAEAWTEANEGAREFDGLLRAMSLRILDQENELTPAMRAWISGVLMGVFSRPPSKGGPDRAAGGAKRIAIAKLVYMACLLGLKRTRNTASEPTSACDAVVVALSESGYHTSYEAVAKSWTKYAQAWMKEALD